MTEDAAAWRASLPRKRMGSGALIRDGHGRVLLVEPTYKATWELPGGAVEADESPRVCCERELLEELGLRMQVGRLLCIEWQGPEPDRTESLMLVYDGGVLPAGMRFSLPAKELAGYRFVEADELDAFMAERLARRTRAAVRALAERRLVELEHGVAVPESDAVAWGAGRPRLVLLNGPPGIGKSTLARRYVAERPLAFCLDIDGIRALVGGWHRQKQESGLLARAMAVEMARTHLSAGHDVIIPQFLGRLDFIEQLQALATQAGAIFCEVVLMDTPAHALARFHARAGDPSVSEHHAAAAARVSGDDGLALLYARLQEVVAARPHATVLRTRQGEHEAAYNALVAAIEAAVAR